MPVRIKATYNFGKDTTTVQFSGMEEVHNIHRLDFLQDVLGEITQRYNEELEEFRKLNRMARKKFLKEKKDAV